MTERRIRAGWLALALLSTAPAATLAQDAGELALPGADTAEGSPAAPPLAPDASGGAGSAAGGTPPGQVRVFLRSRRTAPVHYTGGSLAGAGTTGAQHGAGALVSSVVGAQMLEAAAMEALADPSNGAQDAVEMILSYVADPAVLDLRGAKTLGEALVPAGADAEAKSRAADFRNGLVQGLEELLADPLPGGLAQAAFDPAQAGKVLRWRRVVPLRLADFAASLGRKVRAGVPEARAYTGAVAVLEVAVAAAQQGHVAGWQLPARRVGDSKVMDAAGVAHEAVVGRFAQLVLGSPDRVVPRRLCYIPPLSPSTGLGLMGVFLFAVWVGTMWLATRVGRQPPTPVEVEDPLAKKAAAAAPAPAPAKEPVAEPEVAAAAVVAEEVAEAAAEEPSEAEASDEDGGESDDSAEPDESAEAEEPDDEAGEPGDSAESAESDESEDEKELEKKAD